MLIAYTPCGCLVAALDDDVIRLPRLRLWRREQERAGRRVRWVAHPVTVRPCTCKTRDTPG